MNAFRKIATRRSLVLCALLPLIACPAELPAQSEPLGKQPYDVHIVALLADHRFLSTELFQDQFPRDLTRQTKLALGSLARVDAATSHPLAEAIRREGLDAVLDAYEEVSTRRTWFFVVRFHDGQYQLQGRFFDGLTGLAGPPSRTVTTSDRGRLAHLAARMIAEPFALVGTVTGIKGDRANVALHGSQLAEAAPLKGGSVLALSRIVVESGKLRARRIPWAALEASGPASAGAVSCRYSHRFRENSLAPAEGVVYRALVLPTRPATLKLLVVDQESSQPLAGVAVHIDVGSRKLDLITDGAGFATTAEKIEGLAIVRLSQGGAALAQFPLPIVDDHPVVCSVSPRLDAEDQVGFEVRRHQLMTRMIGTLQAVDQRFGEQRILLSQSLEASLEHAQRTLALLDREIAEIRGERDEIKQLAPKKDPTAAKFEEADKGLTRLTQFRDVVKDSMGRIRQGIADRDVQTEKQKMAVKLVEQASLLQSQAQYDEAIETYEKAASLLPESGEVGKRLAALKADWQIKSDKHRQARKFFVETWPKIDVEVIKDHLVGAKESLDVCRDVGDRLTPRRFLMANVDHLANISKLGESLKKSRSPEDRKRLQSLNEVVATLRQLSNQASEIATPSKQKTEAPE